MNFKLTWLSTFVFIFFILLSLGHSESAFANTVKTVKGKKALIELTDSNISSGAEVNFMSDDNKKIGTGKVTTVKGKKAIAEITSGKAESGNSVHLANSDFSDSDMSSAAPSSRNFNAKKNNWGIAFSFLLNSMNAEETDGLTKETAGMKGNSFGLYGFFDYAFSPKFAIRLASGFEQFKTASTINLLGCNGRTSKDCNVNINYLSGYGYLKYNFTTGKARFFALGGMAMMMAMSKSTTALKEGDISTTSLFVVGGGVDIKMSNKNFIPVSIEYGLFPPSDSVSANSLIFRGGYGWLF